MGVSNLECFLTRSTPVVQSRFLPMSLSGNEQWKVVVEYFNLGDLWDCFDEWSAYGLGSPIVLNRRETVVQYYTPYLSAIQLYIAKPESSSDLSDDCEAKSWSSDGEEWRLSRSSSSNSDRTWDVEDSGDSLENSCWSERDWVGELYFEHFECDGPFGRVPLKDKVDALSHKNWGLRSLNSIDLSPASWVAIAWYPIYHIPTTRNAKNLYASFLTYHNLSSVQENIPDGAESGASSLKSEQHQQFGCGEIHLHPFGMASYRMQRRVWLDHECGSDHGRISSLLTAADSWLKQLKVQHHDYNFFVSRFA